MFVHQMIERRNLQTNKRLELRLQELLHFSEHLGYLQLKMSRPLVKTN
jgi:hypothetical protein